MYFLLANSYLDLPKRFKFFIEDFEMNEMIGIHDMDLFHKL